MDKQEIEKKIQELEQAMYQSDFWNDPQSAQETIKEIEELKIQLQGGEKYDTRPAIVSIFAGAGGDDAEDFVKILFEMYRSFADARGYTLTLLDSAENTMGGFRNISFTLSGPRAYGTLKGESGVHRLVRKSPFNSKSKRQTSFALVEVLPELPANDFHMNEDELEISFTNSGGAGGQNVNKRETAVRVVHPKTGFSVLASQERTQERNRELALSIMRAKLFKKHQDDEEKRAKGLSISDKVSVEWGNQMRSYVFDPYQMIKDHEKDIEVRDIKKVLGGDLSDFVDVN